MSAVTNTTENSWGVSSSSKFGFNFGCIKFSGKNSWKANLEEGVDLERIRTFEVGEKAIESSRRLTCCKRNCCRLSQSCCERKCLDISTGGCAEKVSRAFESLQSAASFVGKSFADCLKKPENEQKND